MSKNLDAVRGSYEASAAGDVNGLLSLLAPDARWTEMAGSPYAGTYTGAEEILTGVFQRLGDEWEDFQAVPEQYVDGHDTIAVVGTYTGTHRATGRRLAARFVHVWWCEDGVATRFEQFADTALLQEAPRAR
ncbi:nuclear transport factor 2 family protein [Streptomyces sp. DT24]|uniref:nuclear transport factor 2 family protein n=1 Tax=unclassified Streptomyces TaxID=2593676 RepID=UPI0023B8E7A8|nr:nuclear transport factor 2 family protein [Streptomyces sp. AM 4-1-1]WEH37059.1 nuclear transport factor 2 family protein [Streptomyces sp. AM 4-1-1]